MDKAERLAAQREQIDRMRTAAKKITDDGTCARCVFFAPSVFQGPGGPETREILYGDCRKYAPNPRMVQEDLGSFQDEDDALTFFVAQWAKVEPMWWCGDFETHPELES